MSRPAERRLPPDSNSPPPDTQGTDEYWLEARMPGVFAAVLATWLVIAAWKAVRHLLG